jgi:hypothetical protein
LENTPPRGTSDIYPPEYFRRQDESDDGRFYVEPRLVVHIDDNAIAAIGEYFERCLPRDGVILDLMSSWRSHLPDGFPKKKLVGLGMNDVEMKENPQLDEFVVHNLNVNPAMPFDDGAFDAAVVTVSIQYMVKPIEIFRDVNRVLRPGGSFHVIYSNRMFPTKAVYVWQMLDDNRRAELIGSYFDYSGGWDDIRVLNITPETSGYTDPVYVVTARKLA